VNFLIAKLKLWVVIIQASWTDAHTVLAAVLNLRFKFLIGIPLPTPVAEGN
jgi:hypothetical protein